MVMAADIWRDVLSEVLAPREVLPVDLWADTHRVMVTRSSALPGRWSTGTTPYLRRPMRLFGHPLVRHLTMMCGSQLGKTEFLLNCLLWLIDNDPAPTITMLANIDAAKARLRSGGR